MTDVDNQINKLNEEFMNRRDFLVKEGVVIDNIPQGRSLEIVKILNLKTKTRIHIDMNLNHEEDVKDKMVIEEINIKDKKLNLLPLISQDILIKFIEEYKVIEEFKPELPKFIEDILICTNSKCITKNCTSNSNLSKFRVINKSPLLLRCVYCESKFNMTNLKLNIP